MNSSNAPSVTIDSLTSTSQPAVSASAPAAPGNLPADVSAAPASVIPEPMSSPFASVEPSSIEAPMSQVIMTPAPEVVTAETTVPQAAVSPSPVAQREPMAAAQSDESHSTPVQPAVVEASIPPSSVTQVAAQRESLPTPDAGARIVYPAADTAARIDLDVGVPALSEQESSIFETLVPKTGTAAAPPSADTLSSHDEDGTLPEQPIDVFQALANAGLVTRSTGGSTAPSEPEMWSDDDVESFEPAQVDVYTALQALGVVPSTRSADAPHVTMPSSHTSPTPAIQRVVGTSVDEAEETEEEAVVTEDDEEEIDLEMLARDVYRMLKDRLRIESERGGK